MKRTRIMAAAIVGALVALGPASAAVADVGPIDWKGGNRDEGPPVTKKSHPSTPSKSHPSTPSKSHPSTPSKSHNKPNKPNNPRVQITNTPKQRTPAQPQRPAVPRTPDRRAQKPAFKVGGPDAIGEAAFYAAGKPVPAVSDGKVEAKGKPAVAPAAGKVEAKGKTPDSSVTITRRPPRQTVVRIPDKPETPTVTPKGGQLPIGAPRTGFGTTAGSGYDPVILATGSAIALGGLALAGVGVARRRRVLA